MPNGFAYQADQPSLQTPVTDAQQTPAQRQQLVAPIALYPDSLVAQILAASTYPAEIVEVDRWLQQRPDLKGEELACFMHERCRGGLLGTTLRRWC